MAKATAKKADQNTNQSELIFDSKRDLNPFWTSSLFSDVYLKNDLPRDYKEMWEKDLEGGPFYEFYNGFIDLCTDLQHEAFDNWREADTVKNWIVPVMSLLGWENNSERHQNSYIDNTSFTIEENGRKQVYRPDLIYFDKPEFKAYTQREKDNSSKLREVKDKKTGSQIVVEAKYWDRLSSMADKYKTKDGDDSASGLGPELQTLKYMDIFDHQFGILSDGKTWKLFHKDFSQGLDRRCYEFDLGNLKELALSINESSNEQKFRSYAKYFFYFFCKESLVQTKNNPNPLVYKIFEHSKKYAHSIEEDLKERFIVTMGIVCNALNKSITKNKEQVDFKIVRNVAESHLFNILFIKSCEVRKILPIQSLNYLRVSLHEVIETLAEMNFDPDKDMDTYLSEFRFGETFGGKKFSFEGFEVFDRFINLYEVIHDGTNASKDFGFEIEGFKESIFTKDEWRLAKTHKINNRDMINILFNLNFIDSRVPNKKYQQIPYSYFSPRQLGSIYESFLEYKLSVAEKDMIFKKGHWEPANLSSSKVRSLRVSEDDTVRKGELYFETDNKDRKTTGSYYTPDFVVKYIVRKTLSTYTSKMSSSELLKLKVCDPALGSGHFIAGALDFLVEEYRTKWINENNDDLNETVSETARKILDSCIYGVDMNDRAVKLAKMSLWLLTAHPGKKLERLDDQIICRNSLANKEVSNEYRKRGIKVSWKELDAKKDFDRVKNGFDVIIGNPPWGAKLSEESIDILSSVYVNSSYKLIDSFKYFIERSLELVSEKGCVGFITPASLISHIGCKDSRNLLMKNGLTEIVDLGDGVFENVCAPSVIYLVDRKNTKDEFKFVTSKNAKTTEDIYSGKIQIVHYDEVKQNPNEEFVVSAMTSSMNSGRFTKLHELCDVFDSGLDYSRKALGDAVFYKSNSPKNAKDYPVLKGRNIERFILEHTDLWLRHDWKKIEEKQKAEDSKTRLKVNAKAYESKEKILIRQTADEIIATYDNKQFYNQKSLLSIHPKTGVDIFFIIGLLNSQYMTDYYRSLVSEEGQAFSQVKKNKVEQLLIPSGINKKLELEISEVAKKLTKLNNNAHKDYGESMKKLNKAVDELLSSAKPSKKSA